MWVRLVVAACSSAAWAGAQDSPPENPAEGTRVEAPKVRLERPALGGDQRLRKVLRDEAARLRVDAGRVHPRLRDIERTAIQTFHPKWDLAEDHPRKPGSVKNTMKEMGKSVLRSWMAVAPRYATNEPLPERPRHPARERPGDEDDATMLEHYDEHVHQLVENANTLSADVCLRLPRGAGAKAEIIRTSGRGKFDRMVRKSVIAAAEARPYPADARAVRACYRYTARFATIPPLPYLSCTLEKSERIDSRCVYPLKRVIGKDVELISVE